MQYDYTWLLHPLSNLINYVFIQSNFREQAYYNPALYLWANVEFCISVPFFVQ